MYENYKHYIEGNDDEEFDEESFSRLINSEIENFNILNIVKPQTNLTSKEIEQYFCHCVPGREGKNHLPFCTALDEDNEIDGHPFNTYLNKRDSEKYFYLIGQSGGRREEFLKKIKSQIKAQIKIKK